MISAVQKEIKKALSKLQYFAIGKIKEIDLANYMIKAEVLTTGMITNWLRIGEDYVGNNFGHVKSPNIDDEILIVFPDGDPSGQGIVVCRLYGKDVPPGITEDEEIYHHKSGTKTIVRKNGSIETTTKNGMQAIMDDEAGEIALNQGSHEMIMTGDGVFIGKRDASQPLALGYKLLSYLSKLKVICTSPGQLSSTPQPPPTKDILSDHYFTKK
ncbi:MAG: phage baseplate assembly protein V [bacterium]